MTDVFIAGGGPAGAAAARLLAVWGWSVVVVNRSVPTTGRLAESLPPSVRKLLAFLGQLDSVEPRRDAGYPDLAHAGYPNLGNVAHWAGTTTVTHTDASGVHVQRRAFDGVLRESARRSGVRFVEGTVERVELGEPLRIQYRADSGRTRICHTRRLLDCSGRAGLLSRHGLGRRHSGYKTMAITAEWQCERWPADEHAHTFVESCRDGWVWSVPLSPARRQCTVMIDPERFSPRTRSSALQDVYIRKLADAPALAVRLARSRQTSAPWTCDASLYDSPSPADGGALLVGDAASFIEPLSSAGVKKALASAWCAAVVTNTCLTRPDMAAAALDFYARREAEVYDACCSLSRGFFERAAAAHDHPFWSIRVERLSPSRGGARAGSPLSERAIFTTPGMRSAFDRLRRMPRLRLTPTGALRIERIAAIEGREVVMREALALPGLDRPLRFAAGINLVELTTLARQCGDMSSLLTAYASHVQQVQTPQLLAGLSLLVAHGVLTVGSAAL